MDSNQQTQQPRQLQQWQQPQTQTQDQALSRVQEAFPRVQVLANSQTASPPPNSPNISTDEAVNSENTNLDTADDMGQFSKSGPRGQLVHRPDFSDVLSIEQTKQLQHLVSCILDGMNDEYKELWAIFGVNDNTKSARITGPIPLPAQFVTIPNPNSPKYAHLYGRKPLYPDGEGLKDGAAADGDSKPNAITDKTAAKPKPKFGKPPVPILPPGMTPNDMKAINAGNKPKIFGGPPVLTLPPGITPDMLPLKMPKTFQESLDMFGKKSIEERMRSDLGEMKRDTLAAFGKFKAAASKRIDLIVVRRGGNAGNVVTPREHLESKGTTSGTGRPVGSSAQNTNVGGRPQQQHKSLPIRTSATAQCQNSAGSGGSLTSVNDFNASASHHFTPHETPLANLPREKRVCIAHCMALTLLGLGDYCAFTRVLLCHLATSLNVPLHVLADTERRISMALAKIVENITPEELQARRFEEGKYRSRGRPRPQHDSDALTNANLFAHNNRPATANIGDHVDGLAAPLVSAGLSTVFGGLGVPPAAAATMLQGMTESTVVVGTLFGLYGSRATAKMTESYAKDIQDFGLLPVNGKEGRTAMIDPKDVPPDDRRLRLTICIPGFLDPNLEGGDNCKSPFKVLGDATEVYTYQWETEVLFKTGAALDKLLKAPGWSEVKKDIHFRSVTQSINTATWPAALIRLNKIIDNAWASSLAKAEKAGQVIADAILNKIGGERSVNLIGYGPGARAVWVALMNLAEKRAFGYVESAILIGCPGPADPQSWAAARGLVSGRLLNAYSKNDIMLGFAMRTCNFTEGIAGLEEIVGVPGVENFDASKILHVHNRYRYLIGPLLQKICYEDIHTLESLEQERQLHKMIDAEIKRDALRDEIARKVAAVRKAEQQREAGISVTEDKTATTATEGSKV